MPNVRFYRQDGKEDICYEEAKTISLEDALGYVESHPVNEGDDVGYFIGFINEKDEEVQFVRFDTEDWMVDASIQKHDKLESWQGDANTSQVKQIVSLFANGKGWQKVVKLSKIC